MKTKITMTDSKEKKHLQKENLLISDPSGSDFSCETE